MFFGKKKEKKTISLDEIRNMASQGMSDKDIIKDLKHRGYAYDEIEKAMLAAVKEGVEDKPLPAPKAAATFESFAPPEEDIFAQLPSEPQEFELPAFEEAPEESSAVLEELIEGVIEEKWHKFDDRFAKIEESFDRIKSEIKQFEIRVEQQKRESPVKEVELKLSDMSEQLEDLDARVGGLEKAFKQFLPALTRNIEALSQAIHELKEKGHVELEEEV